MQKSILTMWEKENVLIFYHSQKERQNILRNHGYKFPRNKAR